MWRRGSTRLEHFLQRVVEIAPLLALAQDGFHVLLQHDAVLHRVFDNRAEQIHGEALGVDDAESLAVNLLGAIIKDPVQDRIVLQEYLETVVRERKEWRDLYNALREVF